MIPDDKTPVRRADNLLNEDRDPYASLRGEWVTITSGQRSEAGKYLGLTVSKIHVLRPYLAHESDSTVPDGKRSTSFSLIDKPGLISDTPDINVTPMRKEYIYRLAGLKLEDEINSGML